MGTLEKKILVKSKYVLVCISVRIGFPGKSLNWNNKAILWLKEITQVEVFGVHLQTQSTAYFGSLQCLLFWHKWKIQPKGQTFCSRWTDASPTLAMPHQEHGFETAWSTSCQWKGSATQHCRITLTKPQGEPNQGPIQAGKGKRWVSPRRGPHHKSNDAGPRKRVGMPDSGGDKAVSIPPDSGMNAGQQRIILKVQLSRAVFFPCAKNRRVELMLQHIIIFILPYPRSFPQHSTYHYRQPSGDLGAKKRAARLTQSA